MRRNISTLTGKFQRGNGPAGPAQLKKYRPFGLAPAKTICRLGRAAETVRLFTCMRYWWTRLRRGNSAEERLQAGMSSGGTHHGNSHGFWPYLALAAGVLCISWSAIFVRW